MTYRTTTKPCSIIAGYATIGQGAGPMIVTERAGLFTRHGLQVETRLMRGAVGVVRGLMEGEIQFGNLAAPALLRSVLVEGADLAFLTGGINQQFLMGRPGMAGLKDLAGGRLGLVGDRGLNDVLIYFIKDELDRQGLQDIRLVPIPGGGRETLIELLSQKCDAVVITPPEAIEAKRKGCRFLVDFSDYGLNYALGGIAARRAYIKDHEEIARKFVRAYVEGMHRYRTDREFTVRVQREYSGITDQSIAEETYDVTRPGMPDLPRPVLPALKKALEIMSRQLPAAAGADPAQFVEEKFIREIESEGSASAR
ncbi:MAG: ABC transporter substrate-binding protein [Deltaproteobacteria bacterium]|nr:ABC transporter substrate-binding protein [Deltaproteobacteria bacterium]